MAIAEAVKQAIYLHEFLKELDLNDDSSVTIYNDNKGAQLLSRHPRTKHIDIKYHFIRDSLRNERLKLLYMSTN